MNIIDKYDDEVHKNMICVYSNDEAIGNCQLLAISILEGDLNLMMEVWLSTDFGYEKSYHIKCLLSHVLSQPNLKIENVSVPL